MFGSTMGQFIQQLHNFIWLSIDLIYLRIREGRATMVSAFASFKFGVAFCFTQLIMVLIIFSVSSFGPIFRYPPN